MVRKALITGANGFTGRYLAPKLARAGYEVHGTVLGESETEIPGVAKLHRADIADPCTVLSLVSDIRPNKVVHLAAISFVGHSDIAEMYRTNILGTRNVLEAIASQEQRPTAVLLVSSANIYGNRCEGVVDETTPPAPANDYGVTKAATELLAAIYGKRLPIIVVRPFNYTGRGQTDNFVIPKIVSHINRRASVIELGNLAVARDFSDVRTVVEVYARLLETPRAIGGTFNICSGRAVSLSELIEMVIRISGHQLEVQVNPALVRSDEVKVLRGSPSKLQSAIGSLKMLPIEETISWMLED